MLEHESYRIGANDSPENDTDNRILLYILLLKPIFWNKKEH